MKKTTKRFWLLLLILLITSTLVFIILAELKSNISFFYTPTELKSLTLPNKIVRVSGFIVENSIERQNDNLQFTLTDSLNTLTIYYKGILPPLFREKIAVVVQGQFIGNAFIAKEILIKHDEIYKPPRAIL